MNRWFAVWPVTFLASPVHDWSCWILFYSSAGHGWTIQHLSFSWLPASSQFLRSATQLTNKGSYFIDLGFFFIRELKRILWPHYFGFKSIELQTQSEKTITAIVLFQNHSSMSQMINHYTLLKQLGNARNKISYYRCNNYVARKVSFCVIAWT